MSNERRGSIVPMFGGATSYVKTLDTILDHVLAEHPSTDELINWHRDTFENVSRRDSIQRRLDYLESVTILDENDDKWTLGPEGQYYVENQSPETLLEVMCRRNVGLRSLLYALAVGPMEIEDISHQQLEAHPQLGWKPSNYDMPLQRVNWLRSLGLVQREAGQYSLTAEGHRFVDKAVETWADHSAPSGTVESDQMTAEAYETVVETRSIDPEFRMTAIARFDETCPISGVDHPTLLDVAHILPWAEYPEYRANLQNVIPLSKLHHAAFDRAFFTLDVDYCLQVNPAFETDSKILQETITEQAGERMPVPDGAISPECLRKHNAALKWA